MILVIQAHSPDEILDRNRRQKRMHSQHLTSINPSSPRVLHVPDPSFDNTPLLSIGIVLGSSDMVDMSDISPFESSPGFEDLLEFERFMYPKTDVDIAFVGV